MAKKEEEVVEQEIPLTDLLKHSRMVDANIVAVQTQQAREDVKAQWGLIDPSEIADQAPVVTKPATKKELAQLDSLKRELDAANSRMVELGGQLDQLATERDAAVRELTELRAQLSSSSSTKTDEEAAAGAAAKLAQQSGDEPPPWLQGEQK